MRTPLLRWLALRARIVCVIMFVIGSLLPPYVPKAALAPSEEASGQQTQFLFVEEGFLMKSASLGEQGTRLAFGQGIIHTVKKNENIQSIAKKYGIAVETIRYANNLSQKAPLLPGQELIILPVDGVMHVVRKGQTLSQIAQLYSVPESDITRQNDVRGGFIIAGQQLIIPGGKPIAGQMPAIASLQDTLRFGGELPSKDIQLKLRQIEQEGEQHGQTATITRVPPTAEVDTAAGILQMPCNNCVFTQYYHPGHYAVDIQTRGGGPVFAAEAGTVIRADTGGWNGGYGNVIEIDHGNGLVTLYAHNKELYVKNGDSVQRGQIISWMGNTGLVYGATGIHTHFEVRFNGVKKNPLLYLE
ncbi:peptidoglycan DD-metalloendopeptidase family protein [Candidatus Peregrinibacteria bacterium]|nr:peptidoglycan DD-metalloendopeptidase family protein [Candidatus Peregrinibacteria bacterium]